MNGCHQSNIVILSGSVGKQVETANAGAKDSLAQAPPLAVYLANCNATRGRVFDRK